MFSVFCVNLILNSVSSKTLQFLCRFKVCYSTVYPDKYLRNKIMQVDSKVSIVPDKKVVNNEYLSDKVNEIKNNLSIKYNVTFSQPPTKSENDTKEYLVMKLKNGLTTLLISDVKHLMDASHFMMIDPTTQSEILEYGIKQFPKDKDANQKEKLAACALTVRVGSFSDPDRVPGLAHLLEHMLFLGSAKFPDENDFNSFVTARGGSNNASTDCETTTFFYDCPEIFMEETMDRFANFFISPLMRQDTLLRERLAIESEFQMHSKNDRLRTQQILATTASIENPARKFMWGNLKTLKEDIDEDTLYRSLVEFHKTQYSGHLMTVAVQARLPLSTLARWVAVHFGNIPTNDKPKDVFSCVDPPFDPTSFNKLYTVMPVSDVNMLRMTWPMPSVLQMYRFKPTLYPTFMMNNESKGSLMAYLKKNLWALNVLAGSGTEGIDSNSSFSLFTLEILLTELGLVNIEKVLRSVFSYIKLLQNEKSWMPFFNEMKFLADTNFRFITDIPASEYVQYLSQTMQTYLPVDYLTGSDLLFEYKQEYISFYMDQLTPERVNVMLLSKTAADQITLDKTEKWFGTKYNVAQIPEDWMREWKDSKPERDFYLPPPNPFIPSDFRILPFTEALQLAYPEKLISDEHVELWFKQDRKFLVPLGYMTVYMISPYSTMSHETAVMCELFVALFSTVFDEEIYPAFLAGLVYSLSVSDYGLLLNVTGYNEKLQSFLETIVGMMVSLEKNLTPGVFEAVKENQRKLYYNDVLNPTALAKELRLALLCDPFCTSLTKLEVIASIDIKHLLQFCENYFRHLYIKCLVQGNISKKQAMEVTDTIKRKLRYNPLLKGSHPKIRVRQLPKKERVICVKALNDEDRNCHVTNYYQCGLCKDVREVCLVEMLMMNMSEPLFDMLRTKEQLGYFVSNNLKYTYGVLGFTLDIKFQSDKFTVPYVESRMVQFLDKMKTDLKNMTTEDFDRLKTSTRILKLQADNQLLDEVERNWSEIETDEYVFDRLKREIDYLQTLEKEDLYKYFISVLDDNTNNDKCLRKISVQVDGSDYTSIKSGYEIAGRSTQNLKHVLKITVPDDQNKEKFIKNVEDFQSSLYIYPVVKFQLS